MHYIIAARQQAIQALFAGNPARRAVVCIGELADLRAANRIG
jgi:hypothetical protein